MKIYDYEPFKDVIEKAVAIGYAIILWHPFVYGNKRTGIFLIGSTLAVNGIYMALPPYLVKYSVQAAMPDGSSSHLSEK